MRKLATLALAVLMVVSLLSVSAFAETYLENSPCDVSFEIKKANPANVIKDGKIGEGEYTEVVVAPADLCINFISSNVYTDSDAMAQTMKFYFSWDETHGLNFAVSYDAGRGFQTAIPMGEDAAKPMDDFCYNMGLNFSSGRADDGQPFFYYSIGKDIATGKYLTGHWGQLGATGAYTAVAGQDFEVSYNGTVVTYEWSVPFNVLGVNAVAGSTVEINLAGCAGTNTLGEGKDGVWSDNSNWSVSLGQFGFLCAQTKDNKSAIGTLSDELIPGGTTNTGSNNDVENTTPAPTQTTEVITSIITEEVVVTNDEGEVVTNEEGEAVTEIITSIVTKPAGNGNNNVPTGDPAVIAAVVAAISACGVVVAKKRK